MKKEITASEYYQILGLMLLAKKANEQLKQIEISIAEIVNYPLDEYMGYGHISDQVVSNCDADELLRLLNIEKPCL